MKRFVWVLQVVFGVFFVVMGLLHFVVPDSLPSPLSWMYDVSATAHYISGSAEILGGLGLILPGWTGIMPSLTPLAAGGLVLVMLGAVLWHASRGEVRNVMTNVLIAALLALIAVVRWRVHPLPARGGLEHPRSPVAEG